MSNQEKSSYLSTIKTWLEEAQALVINAGAGMGVDSGLADYRGNGGQWGQVESQTGQSIFEVVNPQAFLDNPAYSWAFFAKRMKDYAETEPHLGFSILLDWTERYNLDYFVLTSNIDGHFQKAGFKEDRIRELHGSLAYFQSSVPEVSRQIWKNKSSAQEILADIEKGVFPQCPFSQKMARPNVYMFRDYTYADTRSKEQEKRFQSFLHQNKARNLLVFEIGSGPHVQSIRIKTRMLKREYGANVVRINPKDFTIKAPGIGIAQGALTAMTEIEAYLQRSTV